MRVETGTWQSEPAEHPAAAFLAARGRGRPAARDLARARRERSRTPLGSPRRSSAPTAPSCSRRDWPEGMRRVALERGVHIFERTEMRALERSRPAVVRTSHGAVKADQVVLTTGSWAAGMPGFRRSFGVIVDQVVATEPIPDRLARDRLDVARRHRRRPRAPLLPASHRRRSHRDRRRGAGGRVRRPGGRSSRHPRPTGRDGGGARAALAVPAARGRSVHARVGRADRPDGDVPALLPVARTGQRACRPRVLRARAVADDAGRSHPGLARAGPARPVDLDAGRGTRGGDAAGAASVPRGVAGLTRPRARRPARRTPGGRGGRCSISSAGRRSRTGTGSSDGAARRRDLGQ